MEREAWRFSSEMTTMDPAPEAMLQLMKSGCISKTKCTPLRCKCESGKLFCTELCTCVEDESCDNAVLD